MATRKVSVRGQEYKRRHAHLSPEIKFSIISFDLRLKLASRSSGRNESRRVRTVASDSGAVASNVLVGRIRP